MTEKELYAHRSADAGNKINNLTLVLKKISMGRLLSFVLSFVMFFVLFEITIGLAIAALVLGLTLFIRLVMLNTQKQKEKAHLTSFKTINQQEADFLDWNWKHFGQGQEYADSNHDYVNDLDIFGEGSLFQFVNRTKTRRGNEILAGYMKNQLFGKDAILLRQEYVKEMAAKLDFRHRFLAHADGLTDEELKLPQLFQWLNNENESRVPKYNRGVRIGLSVSAIAAMILGFMGVLSLQAMVLPFFINLTLVGWSLRKINNIHTQVSGTSGVLTHYKTLLSITETEDFSSAISSKNQAVLLQHDQLASEKINSLNRIIVSFDTRLNMVAGVLMNGLFLWDFVCVSRIIAWKKLYGSEVSAWFDILGNIDAGCSMGNFAFNFPEYTYPVVNPRAIINSMALGHPLIHPGERVCNNFKINTKGEVVIITGANMAGKSTFLRTVATNLVFASMGLPVCAASFEFRPIRIFTSMRTSDSLTKNESYFYAELLRLKTLLTYIKSGEEIFFILDEILKGTNSTDKQKGSAAFLKQLVKKRATGIIATHDLALGKLEMEFPDTIRNVCFEIAIDGSDITFDYKLYPGITKKMNATLLMEQMGLLE